MLRRALRVFAAPMNRESKIVAEDQQSYSDADDRMPSWREVFLYFLFLGFVNIGGTGGQITMMLNHIAEEGRRVSQDSLHQNIGFWHMIPGPQAPPTAIYHS